MKENGVITDIQPLLLLVLLPCLTPYLSRLFLLSVPPPPPAGKGSSSLSLLLSSLFPSAPLSCVLTSPCLLQQAASECVDSCLALKVVLSVSRTEVEGGVCG